MVEYVCVLTAVSLLAIGVGRQLPATGGLPTSAAAAIRLVNSGARSQHVSAAQARAAYKRAPYRKPVLKYLFAAGWIGGTKDRASCLLVLGTTEGAQSQAVSDIHRSAKIMARLRRLNIPPRVAAAALVEGVVSACND